MEEQDAGAEPPVLLIDFDNLNDRRGSFDPESQVSVLLQRAIIQFLDHIQTESLDVRLYGGWMSDGVLSRRGSEVAGLIDQSRLLPAKHPTQPGVLRGSVDLALALLRVPHIEWEGTYAELAGPSRVRARPGYPDDCLQRSDGCPVTITKRFTKNLSSSCPANGCSVLAEDVFFRRRQKMVDTLLACDLIDATTSSRSVGLVTCDLDLVPAIARAASSLSPVVLLLPWGGLDQHYLDLLNNFGVTVQPMELDHG